MYGVTLKTRSLSCRWLTETCHVGLADLNPSKFLFATARLFLNVLSQFVLLAASAGSLYGGPYEDALEAQNHSDYTQAAILLRRAADDGDSRAQERLGFIYENGEGGLRTTSKPHVGTLRPLIRETPELS